MTQKNRPLLRTSDFGQSPNLKRPLNDALSDMYSRLEALENAASVRMLPKVELITIGSLGAMAQPFPLLIDISDFMPLGLVIAKLENLTTIESSGIPTAGVTPFWEVVGREISVAYITGLAINTRYNLTLAAIV